MVLAVESSEPEDVRADAQRWLILTLVLVGHFAVVSSLATVNVALAAVGDDLGAGSSSLQWTISGYQLAFAAMLVTGGRLGDMVGRRRVFLGGLVVFICASVVCAVAPNVAVVIASRVVQGLAGGIASPQVLAIIRVVFPPTERATAFSWFGITSGSGFMVGQLITGGILTLDLPIAGWRAAFLFNALLGAVAVAGAAALLPRRDIRSSHHLDVVGALAIASAVALLLFAAIQGRPAGWPPILAGAPLVATLVMIGFVRHERRLTSSGREPLVDLALFQYRTYRVGMLILIALMSRAFPTWFILTYVLQSGFGFSPLRASLTMAMGPILSVASSAMAPRLLARWGRGMFALAGVVAVGAHMTSIAVFLTVGDSISNWTVMLLVALTGLGNGAINPAGINVALADVPGDRTGAASGLLQTSQQLVAAVATALYGAVFFAVLGASTDTVSFGRAVACTEVLAVLSAFAIIGLSTRLPSDLRPATEAQPVPIDRL